MPDSNNFQHAPYSRSDPGERVRYREVGPSAPPDTLAWQDAMAQLGVQLAQAGVRAVLFMHGSILNSDLFGVQRLDDVGGLKRGYSRGISGLEALLALMRQDTNGLPALKGGATPPYPDDDQTKRLLDDQIGDAGNFTSAYVETFRKAVNRQAPRPIACLRSLWASEHHHLGRADAAWRLIDRLRAWATDLALGPGDRILVQAHGQAGLVLALVSNLLAPGNTSGKKLFFQALAGYYLQGSPTPGTLDRFHQVESWLAGGRALNGAVLDVATFGTPIRYGWDPSGLGRLLHIVNHRPMRADGKRWLAKMELPQITMEMPYVWGGDYVQQLAVAVTDALPATPGANAANKAMWELLEPYDGFERWLECARKCVRCASDGLCLLVDYKDMLTEPAPNVLSHVYGHAAYTRLTSLLFNTTEIVQALYGLTSVPR